jgi:uncharacterized protein (TIGR03067 family)
MHRQAALVLCAIVPLAAAPPPRHDDLAELQGRWEVSGTNGLSIIIKGDRFTSQNPFADAGGTTSKIRVDGSKSPKTIDLQVPGKTWKLGIYRVRRARLMLCIRLVGQGRPASFDDSFSSNRDHLMMLNRAKEDSTFSTPPRPRSASLGAAAAALMWDTCWDKPVNPAGDCRFDRKGDKLTITVPGKGHGYDIAKSGGNAPRLLRDVEGDFSVQVRVGGDFLPKDLVGKAAGSGRMAGLFLSNGVYDVPLELVVVADESKLGSRFPRNPEEVLPPGYARPGRGGNRAKRSLANGDGKVADRFLIGLPANRRAMMYWDGPPLGKPVYLRLDRIADVPRHAYSLDGKKWTWLEDAGGGVQYRHLKLPGKLKVGVIAEATADGSFQPWFDQFKLTPLGGKAR